MQNNKATDPRAERLSQGDDSEQQNASHINNPKEQKPNEDDDSKQRSLSLTINDPTDPLLDNFENTKTCDPDTMLCGCDEKIWPFWIPLVLPVFLFEAVNFICLIVLKYSFSRVPCKEAKLLHQENCFEVNTTSVNVVTFLRATFVPLLFLWEFFALCLNPRKLEPKDHEEDNWNLVKVPALLLFVLVIVDVILITLRHDMFLFGFSDIAGHVFGFPMLFSIPFLLEAVYEYRNVDAPYTKLLYIVTFLLAFVETIYYVAFIFKTDLHVTHLLEVPVRYVGYLQLQVIVVILLALLKIFVGKCCVKYIANSIDDNDTSTDSESLCMWVGAGCLTVLVGVMMVLFKYIGGNNKDIPNHCTTFNITPQCDRFTAWLTQALIFGIVTLGLLLHVLRKKEKKLFFSIKRELQHGTWFWVIIFLIMLGAQIGIVVVQPGYWVVIGVHAAGYPMYLIFAMLIRTNMHKHLIGDKSDEDDNKNAVEHRVPQDRCRKSCWKLFTVVFVLLFYVDLAVTLVHTVWYDIHIEEYSGHLSIATTFLQVTMETALIVETLLISVGL